MISDERALLFIFLNRAIVATKAAKECQRALDAHSTAMRDLTDALDSLAGLLKDGL